jgi:chromosome partitioning protein
VGGSAHRSDPSPVGWLGVPELDERYKESETSVAAMTGGPPANGKPARPAPGSGGEDESHRRIRQALTDATVSRETGVVDDHVSRETREDDLPIAKEAKRAVDVLHPTGLPKPPHRRIMCVANQKGGVGKTTTAVNLGVALAMSGLNVLVIDLDPQGNASTGLDVDHRAGTLSVYDALINEATLKEVAQPVEGMPTLKCVPATIDLAGAEIELVSLVARESRLQRAIEAYPDEVDYVLVDCPPSLGLLTVNAMVAAEEVLIPIQCEYYALEGLGQLLNNIDLIKAHLNPKIRVSTILLTMYDARTKLADQVANEVREYFKDTVLTSVIPRSVKVSEAPGYGQSVLTYDPGSRGATSYLAAAKELAERGVSGGGSR